MVTTHVTPRLPAEVNTALLDLCNELEKVLAIFMITNTGLRFGITPEPETLVQQHASARNLIAMIRNVKLLLAGAPTMTVQ